MQIEVGFQTRPGIGGCSVSAKARLVLAVAGRRHRSLSEAAAAAVVVVVQMTARSSRFRY